MITNSEFVDRCVGGLRANTKDGHISRRYILNIGMTKARYLISQKIDEMSMFKEEGVISYLNCFELSKVTHRSCDIFEFSICDNIMQSNHKLPEGFFGKNGSGIVAVSNLEGELYDPITPRAFQNLKKRNYILPGKKYYTIKDGRLVLPDDTNEIVDIVMFAAKRWEIDEKSGCGSDSNCKSRWEYEFVCPDRFLDLVVKDTIQELASVYRTSIEDENGNLDSNIKSSTEQN
jgi:hypothetical protein